MNPQVSFLIFKVDINIKEDIFLILIYTASKITSPGLIVWSHNLP